MDKGLPNTFDFYPSTSSPFNLVANAALHNIGNPEIDVKYINHIRREMHSLFEYYNPKGIELDLDTKNTIQ